jgi:hypothetical protein
MTEYELETLYAAIREYVKARLQQKALRDRPKDYDGATRQIIESLAVAQILAFGSTISGYGYVLIDSPTQGIYQDCHLVHRKYVEDFKNGLYNRRTGQWHGDLTDVPEHAVIPVILQDINHTKP